MRGTIHLAKHQIHIKPSDPSFMVEMLRGEQNESHHLDQQLKSLLLTFDKKESEDTWHLLDEALIKFHNAIQKLPSELHAPAIMAAVKKAKACIINSIMSERTRLSRTAVCLVDSLSAHLGDAFEPLVDIFVPTLLKLTTRANKLSVQLGLATLLHMVENSHIASALPKLQESLYKAKSAACRLAIHDVLLKMLSIVSPHHLERYSEYIETIIRDGVSDSLSESRSTARKSFEQYRNLFPLRAETFAACLPEAAKKMLNVAHPMYSSGASAGSAVTFKKPRPSQGGKLLSAMPAHTEPIKKPAGSLGLRKSSFDNHGNHAVPRSVTATPSGGAQRIPQVAPTAERRALNSKPIRAPTVTAATTVSSSYVDSSNNRNPTCSTSSSSSRNNVAKPSTNALPPAPSLGLRLLNAGNNNKNSSSSTISKTFTPRQSIQSRAPQSRSNCSTSLKPPLSTVNTTSKTSRQQLKCSIELAPNKNNPISRTQ
ncbi:hypothetical protein SeMB42_g05464 [Synchytrium endobioticum]|uniref:CLASP N-terminal domain-containing protein n=1 Tax=Synchytrium endobioticum TaxID=286115 RepID=A0A507D4N4_9FUNG|nr:hypothetical protein SeMB42_g05464 [Synchytrium endobioticum]TPX46287.1 hypothetical protein SeLEV6574_g03306 [Synchytrium endobioticum]